MSNSQPMLLKPLPYWRFPPIPNKTALISNHRKESRRWHRHQKMLGELQGHRYSIFTSLEKKHRYKINKRNSPSKLSFKCQVVTNSPRQYMNTFSSQKNRTKKRAHFFSVFPWRTWRKKDPSSHYLGNLQHVMGRPACRLLQKNSGDISSRKLSGKKKNML